MDPPRPKKLQRITGADRKAAAVRAAKSGLKPGVAGVALLAADGAAVPLPGLEGPGGVPHYFGPYGNWAYSPMPSFGIASVTVDSGGSGYSDNPAVTITDVYGTGTATASATVDPTTRAITAITVDPGSSGFHVPFVTITDPTGTGTGAAATAILDVANPVGGLRKFVDRMPGLGPAGANNLGQYIPSPSPRRGRTAGRPPSTTRSRSSSTPS